MSQLFIRRATEIDVAAITALSRSAFGSDSSDSDTRRAIRTGVVFVAFDGPVLVAEGQAWVDHAYADKPWEIREIVVHIDRRRTGIGRTLMRRLIEAAPPRCQTVIALAATEEGRRLASAEGFVLGEGLRMSRPIKRAA